MLPTPGFHHLHLNSVDPEAAIGFYERLGARPLSEWTVYRLTGEALTDLARGK